MKTTTMTKLLLRFALVATVLVLVLTSIGTSLCLAQTPFPSPGGPSSGIDMSAANIVSKFTGCSGIQYLGADGGCHNSGGGASLPLAGGSMTGMPTVPVALNCNGASGSTNYEYCVTATDANSNTITTCPAADGAGFVTLDGSHYYTITVSAWVVQAPNIAPVGACSVYRMLGGATQGIIGTIASCASGGSLNDTGLTGDGTSPPADTSGVIISGLGRNQLSGYTLTTSNSSLSFTASPGVPLYWTHNAIFGNGTFTNSGITAVGFSLVATAHICTVIGYGTACTGDGGTAIGTGSSTIGGLAIDGATANGNGMAIGKGANITTGNAIGQSATSNFTWSWAIGEGAITTGYYQFVIGNVSHIADVYFGGTEAGASAHGTSYTMALANGAAGTTGNRLAKLDASGNAVMTAITDTTLPVYITAQNAGTTGNAFLASSGVASCASDVDGVAAIGDYLINSTSGSGAGRCRDAGTTLPVGSWIVGIAQSTAASNALVKVLPFSGFMIPAKLSTAANCSSSASPAVCAAASSGSVVVAAAATTVVVNTTAVTAVSQIFLTYDSSLGTKLGVTCNVTEPALYGVTARTAATSFTITSSSPTTNPACFSYTIVN